MKRLLIFFALCLPFFATAQSLEVGLLFGASGYQGDLSPSNNRLGNFSDLGGSFGIFGRYSPNRLWSYRVGLTYGVVSADDANSESESRRRRNLNFRSRILELSAVGEFNFLGRDRRFSPYVFGGVALFNFNPQAEFQGQRVDLQPLGTEGQGMDNFPGRYSRTQLSIPLGLGFNFAINDRLKLGVETGLRKTFTDYLDDVSGEYINYNELLQGNGQLAATLANRTGEFLGTDPVLVPTGSQRGNPDSKDWYFVTGVTLSYSLFDDDNGWAGGKDQIGCPY